MSQYNQHFFEKSSLADLAAKQGAKKIVEQQDSRQVLVRETVAETGSLDCNRVALASI